jgi:hypothetical protein
VTTDDETSPSGELTDKQLDQLLAAANTEILQHIEATADPTHTLTAIMAQNTATTPVIHGATEVSGLEAGQIRAASMIGMRSTTHRLIRVLNGVRDLARDLDRDLDLARGLADGLDVPRDRARTRDVARILDDAYARARDLEDGGEVARALDLVRALDLDLARTRGLEADLARLARDLNIARSLNFVHAHDVVAALDLAHRDLTSLGLARLARTRRDLTREVILALDLARDLARDLADGLAATHARAQHLVRSVDAQQVDASGADLSEVRIEQLDVLNGTIWTDQTIWPTGIEDQVRTHSEEIRPGVYQVRCGNEPDHSDLTWV